MPLSLRLEERDDVRLKPQMHGLSRRRHNQFGPCPVRFQIPLVRVLGNPVLQILLGGGIHTFAQSVRLPSLFPQRPQLLSGVALDILVSPHRARSSSK